MAQKKVLITGVTSLTGASIARAFVERGWQVAGTLTKDRVDYTQPLMVQRLEHSQINVFFPSVAFGSQSFLKGIAAFKPDVFVNHGAAIDGYRKPDFEYITSLRTSLFNAQLAMRDLAQAGCSRFVQTGTIFEPREGFGDRESQDTPGLSIYGVSKAMIWEALAFFAREAGLQVSKVVIPNPIGILENRDRLIPICAKLWRDKAPIKLSTPDLVRDHIPADWLGETYVTAAEGEARVYRPSAFRVSNAEFVQRFAVAFQKAGFAGECPIQIEPKETNEPLERTNSESVPQLQDPAAVEAFWLNYAQGLLNG